MESETEVIKVEVGPWRIRTSLVQPGKATVSYEAGGQWDLIAVETDADLKLLRDVLTSYLEEKGLIPGS